MPILTIDQAVRRNLLCFLESPVYAVVKTAVALKRLQDNGLDSVWAVVKAGPRQLKRIGMTPEELAVIDRELIRHDMTYRDKPSDPLRSLLIMGHGPALKDKTLALYLAQMQVERADEGICDLTAHLLDQEIANVRCVLERRQGDLILDTGGRHPEVIHVF